MNKQTQALKLALELLDKQWQCTQVWSLEEALDVADNIREALAEQPAQRKPLTGEQIRALWDKEAKPERSTAHFFTAFARAIEAAHGIKGDA